MRLTFTFAFFVCVLITNAQLTITEISYNPPESGIDSLEYIDITNTSGADYDLENVSFSDGVIHTFGTEVISAGETICVCVNAGAMMNVFGKTCIQWTDGGLRNGGELLRIVDKDGNELDAVEFGTDSPWPSASDGTNGNGASIVLCDINADNSDGSNWSAALNDVGVEINGKVVKGSPAEDNAVSCILVPDAFVEARTNNQFVPRDITISVGQTVRWQNVGGGFHNVNGDKSVFPFNPESFGNGAASGSNWTFDHTFFVEGVYEYQCDPHAGINMKGTVTVGNPPAYPKYSIGTITTEDSEGVADSLGRACEISGTVHGINLSTSGGLQFFLIDDNHDGINVFNQNNTLGYEVKEGDILTVRGDVGQFRGLTQFNAAVIVKTGTGPLQSAIVIDSLAEQFESKLVTLNNMEFEDPSAWRGDGSSFNITVTNGVVQATVRISENSELANQPAPTGPFNVTGLVGQFDFSEPFDAFYQLFPRRGADFVPVSSTNDIDGSEVKVFPNPTNGAIYVEGIQHPQEVCLYNLNGQLIRIWENPSNEINLENFKGMYILSIRKEDTIAYKRVLIH